MKTRCKQCSGDSCGKIFCCKRCSWTWHNQNRTLTPNVDYACRVCGKRVCKWVAPSRIASGAVTLEYCSRTCAGVGRSGSNHHQWKGGRQTDKDGYVLVHCPDHPQANASGYVREHRLVMERHIGRHLKRSEVVHHINENTSDNRIENLKLYRNNAEHKREDSKERKRDANGRLIKKHS